LLLKIVLVAVVIDAIKRLVAELNRERMKQCPMIRKYSY
jgi:hypothetical protein